MEPPRSIARQTDATLTLASRLRKGEWAGDAGDERAGDARTGDESSVGDCEEEDIDMTTTEGAGNGVPARSTRVGE